MMISLIRRCYSTVLAAQTLLSQFLPCGITTRKKAFCLEQTGLHVVHTQLFCAFNRRTCKQAFSFQMPLRIRMYLYNLSKIRSKASLEKRLQPQNHFLFSYRVKDCKCAKLIYKIFLSISALVRPWIIRANSLRYKAHIQQDPPTYRRSII